LAYSNNFIFKKGVDHVVNAILSKAQYQFSQLASSLNLAGMSCSGYLDLQLGP